ncbi:MAG: hypothetical protein LBT30_08160 [Clostridiales bacterium]|jgi:predicted DNA-binding protein YlxM (UPF0122 family)|nr:hypothetical protein [Clostridiales bacterium]
MGYVKNLSVSELSELYGAVLTDKQREFIRLYYDCDISLQEISELSGISRQAVRDAILRGEKELVRLEDALNFNRKRKEIAKICCLLTVDNGLDRRVKEGLKKIEDIL